LTNEEGKRFVRELLIAFPAFDDVARSSPDIGATHRSWIAAWESVTYAECSTVLRELIDSGQISYDDYRAPGPFIRRLVMFNRSRGVKSEEERIGFKPNRKRRDYTGSPMAAALAKALEMRREGRSQAEIDRHLESCFPIDPTNEPRYLCHLCCDRGLVQVWRPDFINRLPVDELHRGHTYSVACHCSSGERMNDRIKDDRKRLPVYSSGAYCRFRDVGIEEDRSDLADWLAENARPVREWVG
jgi:hypothetical protein